MGASFRCSKCNGDFPVISKRKIEPLSRIAFQIEQRLLSWQETRQRRINSQNVMSTRSTLGFGPKHQPIAHSPYSSASLSPTRTAVPQPQQICSEDFPEVAVEHESPTSPRSFSAMSIHSGLESSSFDPTQRQHTWQSIFKSHRSQSTLSSVPSFAFFACGKSLLLWNERGSGFYDLRDADSISFRRINSCNVQIAAGGTNTCAIAAKTESVRFPNPQIMWAR